MVFGIKMFAEFVGLKYPLIDEALYKLVEKYETNQKRYY